MTFPSTDGSSSVSLVTLAVSLASVGGSTVVSSSVTG